MGNTVVWKPADRRCSRVLLMRLLRGGRPAAGVINFVPGDGADDRRTPRSPSRTWPASTSPARRRVPAHVEDGRRATSATTATTRGSSARPAARTSSSRTRPPTPDAVATAIVRGGFEYQGQKCSAASRVYVAANAVAGDARAPGREIAAIKMGDVARLPNFMGAVIDAKAFDEARDGDRRAPRRTTAEVVVGGGTDDSRGLVRRADAARDERPDAPS